MNSVFNLFKIGIGPSSSHTVGPMLISKNFIQKSISLNIFDDITSLKIELFGSLGATGIGHNSDFASVMGLLNEEPQTINIEESRVKFLEIIKTKKLKLFKKREISFDINKDLILYKNKFLPYHSNAITITAYKNKKLILEKTYYSIGGGEILSETGVDKERAVVDVPYAFHSAQELTTLCYTNNLTISQLVLENEKVLKSETLIRTDLLNIWKTMKESVSMGLKDEGFLPGSLKVKKRAKDLHEVLVLKKSIDPLIFIDWINLYALAVNEQNASGQRVVTAPTNGASGIIPAVLHYIVEFLIDEDKEDETVINFLLTSAAIGILYQKNASISGADVGCQGEIGVACSMAAAGFANYLGASLAQIENAAEIAMEHNLGLTCDPIGGLVQIPCIERNAMASIKAINSARMAMNGSGEHYVSLDKVIKTMFETGKDMMSKYKETSQGGLAVNMTEC